MKVTILRKALSLLNNPLSHVIGSSETEKVLSTVFSHVRSGVFDSCVCFYSTTVNLIRCSTFSFLLYRFILDFVRMVFIPVHNLCSLFCLLSVCACVDFYVHYSTFYSFYVYQISNTVCFLLLLFDGIKKNRNEIRLARRYDPRLTALTISPEH